MLAFPVGAGATDLQQLLQKSGDSGNNLPQVQNGIQELSLKVGQLGYEPSVLNVKNGVPVKLNVETVGQLGCQRGLVFRDFGINQVLEAGKVNVIEFTPNKEGQFFFSCPMGMIRGLLKVEA
jgi:plastocyanin domain-containing protein